MSWQGPSAPRVEGIATKSLVVASWASKPASTASRILRCISTVIGRLQPGVSGHESAHPSPISAAGVLPKIGISQRFFEQAAFGIPAQRCRTFDAVAQPRTWLRRTEDGADRN